MDFSNKRVLVLAAHPDDETLGCGGTIYKMSQMGCRIQLLTFTDGESARGVTNYNRNVVLERVSEMLQISWWGCSDFPDNAMDTIPLIDLAKYIEREIDGLPDIIFTHHAGDLNIDHRRVYEATLTAFRPQWGHPHKILSYYVPSATDFNPDNNFDGNNLYVPLNEDMVQRKLDVLEECYGKEMRHEPHTRSIESVKNRMVVWGSEVGAYWAEKFKVVREVV